MTQKEPTWLEIENMVLREMLSDANNMNDELRAHIDRVMNEARVLAHRLGQDVEEFI